MRKLVSVAALTIGLYGAVFGQMCFEKANEVKPVLSESVRKTYEQKLAEAKADHNADPTKADTLIWVGRRTAYLGDYKEAIRIFSEGIAKFPNDARFYRHRGHRLITLRCFDDAVADLQKAQSLLRKGYDEVEPDGLPNAKNIPTSTLQTNIHYHLGLAYYLKGDWNGAAGAFMDSYNRSTTSDMKIASALWVYASAARYGDKLRKSADRLLAREIKDDLEIIENHDYYKLIKLNKGKLKVEELLTEVSGDAKTLSSASLGYGIGNYFLYNGDKQKAATIFRKIVEGNQWASFGYIAAEVELTRL